MHIPFHMIASVAVWIEPEGSTSTALTEPKAVVQKCKYVRVTVLSCCGRVSHRAGGLSARRASSHGKTRSGVRTVWPAICTDGPRLASTCTDR